MYKSDFGAPVHKVKIRTEGGREFAVQPMSTARRRPFLSLSTEEVREDLVRPSEYRRKKRTKDLKTLGWFFAGLSVGE